MTQDTDESRQTPLPADDAAGGAPPPEVNRAGRAATAFVVKLVVLTLALGMGEAYIMQLSRTGDEPEIIFQLREFVARVGASIALVFDENVSRESVMITGKRMQLIVSVECTALFAKAMFCAAAVAYPAKWRHRIAGCVIGLVGVAILNILRVAGLVLISNWSPKLFDFAHTVLMQWFLISCVAPMWLAWAVWATKRSRSTSA